MWNGNSHHHNLRQHHSDRSPLEQRLVGWHYHATSHYLRSSNIARITSYLGGLRLVVVMERLGPAAMLNAASAGGSCENLVSCGSVDPVDVGRWMWSEEMMEGLLGDGFIISLGWLFREIS